MADQPNPQQPNQVALTGGVYPSEDGTWRVCTWFSKISSEAQANHISGWIQGLIAANIQQNPQTPTKSPEPPQPSAMNGG